ncbi:MAG: CopG family ribbon-helix-helix protein [Pseudomonadota bacterium]
MAAIIARPMSVKLDPETRARLDRLAEVRRRTPHWMLREAVTQYVEREEKRDAFRQDTLKAWEEYRATGLHVTAVEADAWLAQLTEGDDIEPPECHV